jgi:ribonuclease BN (tRNA processing enzyme)
LSSEGELTHFALRHPGGSVGYRIEWRGQSLAYVTDTTATPEAAYLEQIRGVDLLVHEAYFGSDARGLPQLTGHSSLLAVAALAAEAKVGRLVLAHISPQLNADNALDLSAARRIFADTELAVDGMELEI